MALSMLRDRGATNAVPAPPGGVQSGSISDLAVGIQEPAEGQSARAAALGAGEERIRDPIEEVQDKHSPRVEPADTVSVCGARDR